MGDQTPVSHIPGEQHRPPRHCYSHPSKEKEYHHASSSKITLATNVTVGHVLLLKLLGILEILHLFFQKVNQVNISQYNMHGTHVLLQVCIWNV